MKYLKNILLTGKRTRKDFKNSEYIDELQKYIGMLERLRHFTAERTVYEPEPPAKRRRVSSTAALPENREPSAEPMTVDEVLEHAQPNLKFAMKIELHDVTKTEGAMAFVSKLKARLVKDTAHYDNGGHYESTFFSSIDAYDDLLASLQAYHDNAASASAFGQRLHVVVNADDRSTAEYMSCPAFAKVETIFHKASRTKSYKSLEAL